MRFAKALVLVLVLSVGLAVAQDKLFLKDGQVLTGKILHVTVNDVRIRTSDETMRVPAWAIDTIERNGEVLDPSERDLTGKNKSRKKTKPTAPPTATPPEATRAMLEWIDLCVEYMGSDDVGVRSGASAALMAAGTTAGPALEIAADSDNRLVARDASRLLSRVRRLKLRQEEHRQATMNRTERMIDSLGLGEQEARSFESILEEFQLKQRDLSQSIRSGKVDVSQGPTRMAALDDERNEKLAALLSEEQLANFLEHWTGARQSN